MKLRLFIQSKIGLIHYRGLPFKVQQNFLNLCQYLSKKKKRKTFTSQGIKGVLGFLSAEFHIVWQISHPLSCVSNVNTESI